MCESVYLCICVCVCVCLCVCVCVCARVNLRMRVCEYMCARESMCMVGCILTISMLSSEARNVIIE